jgi:hypothetical protein
MLQVTTFNRYLKTFQHVGGDDEMGMHRVPRSLVEALAHLDPVAIANLALRWRVAQSTDRYGDGRPVEPLEESLAGAYLEEVTKMAKVAVDRQHELFVWMGP